MALDVSARDDPTAVRGAGRHHIRMTTISVALRSLAAAGWRGWSTYPSGEAHDTLAGQAIVRRVSIAPALGKAHAQVRRLPAFGPVQRRLEEANLGQA